MARDEILEVKSEDKIAEDNYFRKVKGSLTRMPRNSVILFDFDGTQVANNGKGESYIREGFAKSYEAAKKEGIEVGSCTMRDANEIPKLKNYPMDIVLGENFMDSYLKENPLSKEQLKEVNKLKNIVNPTDVYNKILVHSSKTRTIDDDTIALLSKLQELKYVEDHNYTKLLVLAKMNKTNPKKKMLLIDDHNGVGEIGEILGLAVHIPIPKNFVDDY